MELGQKNIDEIGRAAALGYWTESASLIPGPGAWIERTCEERFRRPEYGSSEAFVRLSLCRPSLWLHLRMADTGETLCAF